MISIEQLRAARGLLNWSQQELAERAGFSVKALNNIERGAVAPRLSTLQALQDVLEKAGVEFTEFSGVKRRGQSLEVKTYEGSAGFEVFLNDILVQLGRDGGEVLLYGVDEEKFEVHGGELLHDYYKKIAKLNIRERVLCSETNRLFLGPPATYRLLPADQISNVPYVVYGETLAIINWGPPLQMVHMRSQAIADAYRKQFEFQWQRAKPADTTVKKPSLGRKKR